MFPPSQLVVYLISLPKSLARREACIKAARTAGLNPVWFEAADGRKLLAEYEQGLHHDTIKLQKETILRLGFFRKVKISEKLSAGELGCAWSHLAIYQDMLLKKIEYALVLEDDALLTPEFKDVLPLIMNRKEEWDILQIAHDCGIRDFYWTTDHVLDKGKGWTLRHKGMGIFNSVFNRRRGAWLTGAYLLNSKAAKRLIEIGFPIRIPADYLCGLIAYNKLRLCLLNPQEAFVNVDSFESEINVSQNILRPKHKLS